MSRDKGYIGRPRTLSHPFPPISLRGMKVRDVAEILDISTATVSQWTTGARLPEPGRLSCLLIVCGYSRLERWRAMLLRGSCPPDLSAELALSTRLQQSGALAELNGALRPDAARPLDPEYIPPEIFLSSRISSLRDSLPESDTPPTGGAGSVDVDILSLLSSSPD